ncbi:MAG: tRNA (guanine-N1)-methyltransferase [Flavobacteriaceae bacterium]|nr:tRNA (guanine-N1)-methyltransferase [Flavobacteriaceae bacterium]MDZ4148120.1 tRNA (guanine-N1)-methyltransferase [Flavobacteriaceae bacterium]
MNNFKNQLPLILCLGWFVLGLSQESESQTETKSEPQTIDNQFEEVYLKSGNYNDEKGQTYEVARKVWLLELQSNVMDTLSNYKSEIQKQFAEINAQKQQIDSLTAYRNQLLQQLEETKKTKDNIGFMGFLDMHKNFYRFVMWFIIIVLLGLFLLFYYKFKQSNIITEYSKNALTDLEEEYTTHRQKALEREQKAMRKLQDEINKNKYKNTK